MSELSRLISKAAARAMLRQGAKAEDFAGLSVFSPGTIIRRKAAGDAQPSRDVGFILSNANLDREGDSIAAQGWDLTAYRNNPVVLWAHDHSLLPVAKASNVQVQGGMLLSNDTFTPPELSEFGDCVLRFLQAGFLNACSVGFRPTEWEMSDTGVNFAKQELLEHSVCPVPAHPDALVVARSKGIDTAPLAAWYARALDATKRPGDAAGKLREEIELWRIQADPKGRTLFAVGLKVPTLVAPAPDPADAAELASYQQMRETLAACGTSLSVANDSVNILMGTPEPGLSDADEEAFDQEQLTIVATNAQACCDGCANVAATAITLGGKPVAASPAPKMNAALVRKALATLKTLASVTKSGRVLSAENEAALRRAVAELEAVLAKLEPPKSAVLVDGKRIEDAEDVLAGITPAEIADVLSRAIAEQLMRVTGRVD